MDSAMHALGQSLPWFLLSLGSAFFQVLRNMVMKRIGHALDETISVWGRFTFILPFAAGMLAIEELRKWIVRRSARDGRRPG